MTTIAARRYYGKWIIAADSQETIERTDAGDIKLPCQKLFTHKSHVIATAGDSSAGHRFVQYMNNKAESTKPWMGSFTPDPERAFECLVLKGNALWLYDEDMTPQEITSDFYAIGTGRMCAFAAMEEGADPRRAVEIAAKYDPYTGGDIVVAD